MDKELTLGVRSCMFESCLSHLTLNFILKLRLCKYKEYKYGLLLIFLFLSGIKQKVTTPSSILDNLY